MVIRDFFMYKSQMFYKKYQINKMKGMGNNNQGNLNPPKNSNQGSKQYHQENVLQSNQQMLIQNHLLNQTMGMGFSAFEELKNRINGETHKKKDFHDFDVINYSKKTDQLLINQIESMILTTKAAVTFWRAKYHRKFDFPQNFNQKMAKQQIKYLRQVLSKPNNQYLLNLIDDFQKAIFGLNEELVCQKKVSEKIRPTQLSNEQKRQYMQAVGQARNTRNKEEQKIRNLKIQHASQLPYIYKKNHHNNQNQSTNQQKSQNISNSNYSNKSKNKSKDNYMVDESYEKSSS